jgi:RNA polymerase-binding transcription factor DksA
MTSILDDKMRTAREWLVARSAELRDRIGRVRSDLRRAKMPLPADGPDAAIVVENDEVLQAIEQAARAELVHLSHAFERLDAGTFGRCEGCGESIESGRLRAVPYTTECRDCAKGT